MAGGQAQLRPKRTRETAEGPSPFGEAGGLLSHPLLRPGAVIARSYQLDIARRCLEASTLVVLPAGLGKRVVAGLVCAERLRSAGGFVLVVTSTLARARAFRKELAHVMADSVVERMRILAGSARARERAAAFDGAWVILATPEKVARDVESGALLLSACSLLVVDEAHRAMGAYAYLQVAQALRRDRPGGLTLALSGAPATSRRRVAALVDVFGLSNVEARRAEDIDISAHLRPTEVEVDSVDMPQSVREIQALLERELEPRANAMFQLGALTRMPLRLITRNEMAAAGAALARASGRRGVEAMAGLHAHTQATILVHALELLETRGCRAVVAFLGRMVDDPQATRAERALAQSAGVRLALQAAGAREGEADPKAERLVAILRDQLRDQPGSNVTVVAPDAESARALSARLAEPNPIGVGRVQGRGVNVVAAPLRAGDALDLGAPDVVVMLHPEPAVLRAMHRKGRAGHGPRIRTIVLVAADTREETMLVQADRGERGGVRPARLVQLRGRGPWHPAGPNKVLPLDAEHTPSPGALP